MYFDANALVFGLYILYCNLLANVANVVESLLDPYSIYMIRSIPAK
jgi:hypothetical protein